MLVSLALIGCGHKEEPMRNDPVEPVAKVTAKLVVTSPAFAANGEIPTEHTCEGADTPPPITWSGAPPGTKSFALVVDDPDAPDPAAPKRTWVHYVVTNIPASASGIDSDHPEAIVGPNDWGKRAWGGPCPPIGRHRYFFKVYALDTTFDKPMTKAELEAAMTGHILAKGALIGTYQQKKK
jgi:Raf kinase inhibitor-like YbhB/YbcL family protein